MLVGFLYVVDDLVVEFNLIDVGDCFGDDGFWGSRLFGGGVWYESGGYVFILLFESVCY